jgi:hypothetical protein
MSEISRVTLPAPHVGQGGDPAEAAWSRSNRDPQSAHRYSYSGTAAVYVAPADGSDE